MLHERLRHAIQGQGQVLGIAGEPGIGKSRLLYEFAQSLRDRSVTYGEGHCLAYARATPYLPVQDLLRQLCGITEVDSSEAITTKLHAYLGTVGMTPADEAPYLLQVLGVAAEGDPLAAHDPQCDQGTDVCHPAAGSACPSVGGNLSSWRWRTCTGAIPPRKNG